MDDKQFTQFIGLLGRMAEALDILARAGKPEEPNQVRPIEEYPAFTWSSIGATVIGEDGDGPTHLEYGGFIWTRRSPANKFDLAIWFSRASGKDAEGNVHYLRLITFKKIGEAEPVSARVAQALEKGKEKITEAATTGGQAPGDDKTGGPCGSSKYYGEALGKRFNLARDWALEIAKLAGVDLAASSPSFTPAYKLLPYFAECKALGWDLDSSISLIKAHGLDPQAAILRVRETTPAK